MSNRGTFEERGTHGNFIVIPEDWVITSTYDYGLPQVAAIIYY